MVQTQFNTQVLKFMSDGGGEYQSKAFHRMLADQGIELLLSPPRTPQINGRAERFMRTLTEKADAMRHTSGIPDSWWEFAVEHATHVYNRTPLRRLGWKTPYELVYKELPNIDHLRVFGCAAYVFIPPEDRSNKLAPKSELMTYVGWGVTGHQFITRSGGLKKSAHALFDESLFPRLSKHAAPRRTTQTPVPECSSTKVNGHVTIPIMDTIDEDYVSSTPYTSSKGGALVNPDGGNSTLHPRQSQQEGSSAPTTPITQASASTAPRRKRPSLIPVPTGSTRPSPIDESTPSWEDSSSAPGPSRQAAELTPTPAPVQRPKRQTKAPIKAPSIYGNAKPTDILKGKSKDWRLASGDLEQASKPKTTSQPVAKEVPVLPAPAPTPKSPPLAERLRSAVRKAGISIAEPALPPMPLDYIADLHRSRTNKSELPTSASHPRNQPDTDEGEIAQEGGDNLILMLFKAAVSTSNEKPIRDFTYRDVLKLPHQEREKWLGTNGAYSQELEALRKRGVFGALQDLPEGRKAIGNRWVHAEKSDGRLKARLVAQGFSQVEGVDYDAVFSPVVRFETVHIHCSRYQNF
jgi:hypothetical protein